jgi:hypothetical protein
VRAVKFRRQAAPRGGTGGGLLGLGFGTETRGPSLIWEFSAECIGILFVEVIVSYFAFKKVQTTFDAIIIGSLFPLSIGVVAGLEAAGLN